MPSLSNTKLFESSLVEVNYNLVSERTEAHSYGFNGQEKDDEVSGAGNTMTAEYWEYDARLGRRFNIDPMYNKYPSESPYSAFHNNPIIYSDQNGDEPSGDEPKKVEKAVNKFEKKVNKEVEKQGPEKDIEAAIKKVESKTKVKDLYVMTYEPNRGQNSEPYKAYSVVEEYRGRLTQDNKTQYKTETEELIPTTTKDGGYEVNNYKILSKPGAVSAEISIQNTSKAVGEVDVYVGNPYGETKVYDGFSLNKAGTPESSVSVPIIKGQTYVTIATKTLLTATPGIFGKYKIEQNTKVPIPGTGYVAPKVYSSPTPISLEEAVNGFKK